MEAEYGQERWATLVLGWENLHKFIRSQFTVSALVGLAHNGTDSDAPIVRPFLADKNSSVRDAAVKAIAKTGGAPDVEQLLKIADEAYGPVERDAATAALNFSTNPLDTALQLTRSEHSEVQKAGFNWLFETDSPM